MCSAFRDGAEAAAVLISATRALPITGVEIDASQVHHSALATVADLYGTVAMSQQEIV